MHKTLTNACIILCAGFMAGCTSQSTVQSNSLDLAANDVAGIQDSTNQDIEDTVMIPATKATISTSKGDIVVELYPEEAPNTVTNFATKAQNGFYENLTFHRVEDWVIQGGDPDGNGTGGGKMKTELNDIPFVEGSLGVARGMDITISNDAQFFICSTDCDWLTGDYTNFGKVIEGMDVVKQISIGDTISSISVEKASDSTSEATSE